MYVYPYPFQYPYNPDPCRCNRCPNCGGILPNTYPVQPYTVSVPTIWRQEDLRPNVATADSVTTISEIKQ